MATLHFNSLSDAIEHFNKLGYTDNFKAVEEGIEALYARKMYQPADLNVEYTFRFEGITDPGDQTELFIISSKDGIKGSLTMSYSAQHNQNIEMIKLLK